MLSQSVFNALNIQMNKEFANANLYLSMSAFLDNANFEGMAAYMRKQSGEETNHANKIFDYILANLQQPIITAIDAPKTNWDSISDVFAFAVLAEKKNTGLINEIVKLVNLEGDFATHEFLLWFVKEQVEEVDKADRTYRDVKLVENDPAGLLFVDEQLGK